MLQDNTGSDPDLAQVIAAELQAVGMHVRFWPCRETVEALGADLAERRTRTPG